MNRTAWPAYIWIAVCNCGVGGSKSTETGGSVAQVVQPAVAVDTAKTVVELAIRGGSDPMSRLVSVRYVAVGVNGEIVVLDRGAANVKVFDSAGRLSRIVGNSADERTALGEFLSTALVDHVGRIVVTQLVNRKAVVFGSDGQFAAAVRLPGDQSLPLGFALSATGVLRQAVAPVTVIGRRRTLGTAIVIREWRGEAPRAVCRIELGDPPSDGGLTYMATPVWDWMGIGDMVVSNGRDFDVRLYDERCHLQRVLRLQRALTPLTSSDGRILVDAATAKMTAQTKRAFMAIFYRFGGMARSYPAVVGLIAASDGTIWLQAPVTADDVGRGVAFNFGHTGGSEWDVISRDGVLVRHVSLPMGFTLTRVQNGRLYGFAVDRAGTPTVQRLRLSNGESQARTHANDG